jgi:hypothetical protein
MTAEDPMSDFVKHPGPDWVVAEMPAGYQNRLVEIERLVTDLEQMGRYARLLWQVGPELAEAARDAFVALKFEAELVPVGPTALVTVRLEGRPRLLVLPSASTVPIQKKSTEVSHVFQLMQEVAEETDRVVLVTNVDSQSKPVDRQPAVAPDALALLTRMGASHMTGPTLFNLWKLSLEGIDRARAQVARLHAEEAGEFELPASLMRLSEMKI